MVSQYMLGFAAGGMSLLAPCVLPLIPIIVQSSLKTSRWGPWMSALGLGLSFAIFGILTNVFISVFDPDLIRRMGALILLFVGLSFLWPRKEAKASGFLSGLSNIGSDLNHRIVRKNVFFEFVGGFLLGIIWAPCTGPTLALAVAMASQSQNLSQAFIVFFSFGLGAGMALLSLGAILRRFSFVRMKLLNAGAAMNKLAGTFAVLWSVLILSGKEGDVQDLVLGVMPLWLIKLGVMI